MAAWKMVLRAASKLPPGPHKQREFDVLDLPTRTFLWAVYQCVKKGFMQQHIPTEGKKCHSEYRYSVTPLGRDYLDGRAEIVGQWGGVHGRAPGVVRVTWLASLPRPEQMRGAS